MGYTEAFKEQMVKRMLGPPAVSASALSKQVDVPQPTLSQWLTEGSARARGEAALDRGEAARSRCGSQEVDGGGEAARAGSGPWTARRGARSHAAPGGAA
jgi:transposase-like protein